MQTWATLYLCSVMECMVHSALHCKHGHGRMTVMQARPLLVPLAYLACLMQQLWLVEQHPSWLPPWLELHSCAHDQHADPVAGCSSLTPPPRSCGNSNSMQAQDGPAPSAIVAHSLHGSRAMWHAPCHHHDELRNDQIQVECHYDWMHAPCSAAQAFIERRTRRCPSCDNIRCTRLSKDGCQVVARLIAINICSRSNKVAPNVFTTLPCLKLDATICSISSNSTNQRRPGPFAFTPSSRYQP